MSVKRVTYLRRLHLALLEDLLDDLLLLRGAKLVLQLAVARGVQDTLLAMPSCCGQPNAQLHQRFQVRRQCGQKLEEHSLRNQDLPSRNDI